MDSGKGRFPTLRPRQLHEPKVVENETTVAGADARPIASAFSRSERPLVEFTSVAPR
jgi:hypothetical protein